MKQVGAADDLGGPLSTRVVTYHLFICKMLVGPLSGYGRNCFPTQSISCRNYLLRLTLFDQSYEWLVRLLQADRAESRSVMSVMFSSCVPTACAWGCSSRSDSHLGRSMKDQQRHRAVRHAPAHRPTGRRSVAVQRPGSRVCDPMARPPHAPDHGQHSSGPFITMNENTSVGELDSHGSAAP